MRIAYFGYDFFVDTLERLVSEGTELVQARTFEQDGDFLNKNNRLIAFAQNLGVPVEMGQPSVEDMEELRDNHCDLVLVMGFKYKVPVIEGLRCVNLHPALLPYGRGPFPLPWLILYHPEYSGLTLHQVTDEMDSGPILAQVAVPVGTEEGVETLCAKMQIAATDFIPQVVGQLDTYWRNATKPVDPGIEWRATESDWTIDWQSDWRDVLRTIRAFGALGSGTTLEGQDYTITMAMGWPAEHQITLGTIVHRMPIGLVIAANDGFVLLLDPIAETP